MALFESKEVKEAREFIEVGRPNKAISILLDRISYEAKDFEAYWMLGELYLQKGYFESSLEYFSYALKLSPERKSSVLRKFESRLEASLAANDADSAHDLAINIAKLRPSYRAKAYDLFLKRAKGADNITAEKYLDAAMSFTGKKGDIENVGKRYLLLALENNNDKHLIRKGENILGSEFIDRIFPSTKTVVAYQKTFTEEAGDDYDRVTVLNYSKTKIIPGDEIRIHSIVPAGAPGIMIQQGMDWVPITNNDYYKIGYLYQNDIPSSGSQGVWLQRGFGMKVRIEIIRHIRPKPDLSLLVKN